MRIKICINTVEGGVANFMLNLQSVLQNYFEVEVIHINSLAYKNVSFFSKNRENGNGILEFHYKKGGNTYKAFKRFITTIEKTTDILFANDWFELGAISNFSPNLKIIFILHGDYDYYYNLAKNHKEHISKFICVSRRIESKLKITLPERSDDIICINPLVPDIKQEILFRKKIILDIIFIGRLTESKGFFLLPKIKSNLNNRNIKCNFYIVGSGYDKLPNEYKYWIDSTSNVVFLGQIKNSDLREQLNAFDIFLLPSFAEGFPVSLIETMQAGLVPIVTDLDSGIPELVDDSHNGFIVTKGDALAISDKIASLHYDRDLLLSMKKNVRESIIKKYSTNSLINEFVNVITTVGSYNQLSVPSTKSIYRSRLDSPFVPDFIVSSIRYLYK